jgi:hypothetical protein
MFTTSGNFMDMWHRIFAVFKYFSPPVKNIIPIKRFYYNQDYLKSCVMHNSGVRLSPQFNFSPIQFRESKNI